MMKNQLFVNFKTKSVVAAEVNTELKFQLTLTDSCDTRTAYKCIIFYHFTLKYKLCIIQKSLTLPTGSNRVFCVLDLQVGQQF